MRADAKEVAVLAADAGGVAAGGAGSRERVGGGAVDAQEIVAVAALLTVKISATALLTPKRGLVGFASGRGKVLETGRLLKAVALGSGVGTNAWVSMSLPGQARGYMWRELRGGGGDFGEQRRLLSLRREEVQEKLGSGSGNVKAGSILIGGREGIDPQENNDRGIVALCTGDGGKGERVFIEQRKILVFGMDGVDLPEDMAGREHSFELIGKTFVGLMGAIEDEDVLRKDLLFVHEAFDFGDGGRDLRGARWVNGDARRRALPGSEADGEGFAGGRFFDEATLLEGGDVGELSRGDTGVFRRIGADENIEGKFERLPGVAEALVKENGSSDDIDAEVGPGRGGGAVDVLGVVVEKDEGLVSVGVSFRESAEEFEFSGFEILRFVDVDCIELQGLPQVFGELIEAVSEEIGAVILAVVGQVGAKGFVVVGERFDQSLEVHDKQFGLGRFVPGKTGEAFGNLVAEIGDQRAIEACDENAFAIL
jgi:hypothetical protein